MIAHSDPSKHNALAYFALSCVGIASLLSRARFDVSFSPASSHETDTGCAGCWFRALMRGPSTQHAPTRCGTPDEVHSAPATLLDRSQYE